ncbi:MAG: DNA mismatch repair protein MutS [Alphaproteobacteria bacterium]|nr:DNA mismatch repair protein MutS [Alphaproteobacteria bacterium]
MAEKNKLSPVMQQYVDMKSENPDALLLFRLGDFYEAFFEDAKTVSATLSLVLTHRGTDGFGADVPMCGIPWHAADNYFGRLVKSGFKVALVEQMETPQQAKQRGHKFIERKVVRVLTPGTLTDENLLTPAKSNFLISIVPIGESVFDIAGCDISTGEFFIGQTDCIADDMIRINPAEIIYPEKDAEKQIIKNLREIYKTTPVYEKLYLRSDINVIVSHVFGGNVQSDNRDNVSAITLLAGYLFNTQRGANISFRAPYAFKSGRQLIIDSSTWKSLEIDAPINDGGTCLLDVIDNTKTASGARKLRSYLRTLPGDRDVILSRQTHIGHLLTNHSLMAEIDAVLTCIPDVNRALSRLLAGRGTPRDLRNVTEFLLTLDTIKNVGRKLDDGLSSKFIGINTHDALANKLQRALNDELPTFFRDGNVIRSGFDISLDNMRKLSNGGIETIAGLQAEYINQTNVSNLKIKYNNILGYFIEVPSTKADALMAKDSGFIHRQTMAGNMRFTTSKLIDLDNDIRSASEKATAIENEIIDKLIEDIREISNDLMNTADLVADVDVWLSLARCADLYSWVRPQITETCEFDIVGGRHPVIEYVLRHNGDNFVKNDCNLNEHPIALLTGPNMAGKSTYLRQNAILVVLSHLGSFVPAISATIGICDQLFSRVGASDNLAAGQSTFMVEMVETANILNRATKQSFIIFDEIGRGTSTFDGMAIAQAVLEYLNTLCPRTLFATHYHELTELVGDDKLSNVSCLTIDVREHNNDIVFLHKIIAGVANRSYGIAVAKMAGMPASIVERAENVLLNLENGREEKIETVQKPEKPSIKPVVKEEKNNKSQLSLFG